MGATHAAAPSASDSRARYLHPSTPGMTCRVAGCHNMDSESPRCCGCVRQLPCWAGLHKRGVCIVRCRFPSCACQMLIQDRLQRERLQRLSTCGAAQRRLPLPRFVLPYGPPRFGLSLYVFYGRPQRCLSKPTLTSYTYSVEYVGQPGQTLSMLPLCIVFHGQAHVPLEPAAPRQFPDTANSPACPACSAALCDE